jgi:DNA-binding CsgD family transcriptional regulator
MLDAIAAYERGAVELAGGDAPRALELLRRALESWRTLEAPYEAARARVLIGEACRLLEDTDACTLELEAALADFVQLGARPDVARVEQLLGRARDGGEHGLSRRELEVLRLVAAGKSNREIAAQLVISEHTVARHVQNIFAKLRVSSRTAATAFAFEHDLA